MSAVIIIPARGGSKGIARKNLAMVAGRPLIAWAIEAALAAAGAVVVSTEDAEIAETARSLGAEVPFSRPDELAGDDVSLIPVIAHAARALSEMGRDFDLVASLQPTAPLVRASTIERAIGLCGESGCDSVASVRRIEHNHPYRALRLDKQDRTEPLFAEGESHLQRQDLPDLHAFSGGLYVRRRALLEQWSGRDFCLGEDRRAVVVGEEESLNIDTPLDLAVFRAIVAGHAEEAAQ